MTAAAARTALYLVTLCLLKLFFRGPETRAVAEVIAGEERVLVSELGRLEAETQLRARLHGGLLSRPQHRRLSAELTRTLTLEPFALIAFPVDGFERARTLAVRAKVHCRTLDLLHIAAMDSAGLTRLLTNDAAQATVARAVGLVVTTPRVA